MGEGLGRRRVQGRDKDGRRLDDGLETIDEAIEMIARAEARAAVASLAGLVLRRLQEEEGELAAQLREIFGEALEQFGEKG